MVDSLVEIREFLEANRGEVVILFIEPYVTPQDIEKVFAESGLERYVVTLDRDSPMPTLGDLVRRNKRVIVFTEKDADGRSRGTWTASRSCRTRRSGTPR